MWETTDGVWRCGFDSDGFWERNDGLKFRVQISKYKLPINYLNYKII